MVYPDYKNLWQKVEKEEELGKPKSANELVEQIYQKAKKEDNSPQIYKALVHLSKYQLTLEEDAELSIVSRFKEEINQAKAPEKQILESALAELYWQYFNANTYRFQNRTTTTTGIDENDFRTWDLNKLFEEAGKYYNASLNPVTQQFAIDDFREITTAHRSEEENEFQYLQPTLFDLLAQRAIEFYRSDAYGLTKPAYDFVLRDEQAFAPIQQFLNYQPNVIEENASEINALTIYQQLIQLHKNANREDAMLKANIDRLNYVYQVAEIGNKEELYEQALQQLLNNYKNNETVALAGHQLAVFYQQQGLEYDTKNPLKQDKQFKLKEAIAMCDKIIAQYPDSYGAKLCQATKSNILQPNLSIQAEGYVPNNTAFRFLVDYKNVDEIHYSIAKVNFDEIDEIRRLYGEDLAKKLSQLKTVASWVGNTPNEGDHQSHQFEEVANNGKGLPNGLYIVIASSGQAMTAKQENFGWASMQATNIAYFTEQDHTGTTFYVKDRQTGEAIANANIVVKSGAGRKDYKVVKRLTTDAQGKVKDSKIEDYHDLLIEISKDNETAIFGDVYFRKMYTEANSWNNRSLLFTDRAIYRPGQTVYFKVLTYSTDGKQSNIAPNAKRTVVLRDANHSVVEEMEITTNDFGSAKGNFVLGKDRLLGNYSIQIEREGHTSFSVEEYKRPKFKVELDTLKGNYKLNDDITAKGKATSYAGANISDAKVSYRVTRTTHYPFWFYRYYPPKEEMVVGFGETTTNELGQFEIPFQAIPETNTENDDAVFHYKVIADVTDINGETRSDEITVVVGKKAMKIELQTKEHWKNEQSNELTIATKNLNNQALSAQGNVTITKLIAPQQVHTARTWEAPDQQKISEQEFKQLFPHQAYAKNESEPQYWEEGKVVWNKQFATDATGKQSFDINNNNWETGWYKIKATAKDAFGNDIEQIQLIEITNTRPTKVADNQLLTLSLDKEEYQPNETATIFVGSATTLPVLVQVLRDSEVIYEEETTLNNSVKAIPITLKEQDRGGLLVRVVATKWNSFNTAEQIISVPFRNKKLTVELNTHRDKLQPNSEEEWTFTIKGPNSEQVNAELLVNMFDASLEQFRAHNWQTTIPRRNQSNYYNRIQTNAFQNTYFRMMQLGNTPYQQHQTMHFARLDFFGLNFLGYGNNVYNLEYAMDASGGKPRVQRMAKKEVASAPMADTAEPVVEESAEQSGNADEEKPKKSLDVQPRTNLQETAFFFPQLRTDKEGNVRFSFTTPEALTEWKIMAFGHTKDLQTGYWEGSTITQKELMVTPNAPRFFRQGDAIEFSTKISNLTENTLSGQAELELLDATTLQLVNQKLHNNKAVQSFTVNANGNTSVTWNLQIPDDVPAVTYRVKAKANNFTDGEESALPVLSNRMLVTETLPIPLRSNQTRVFKLDKLANNNSSSLKHHKLTLEMTSNPAWYAVQALPYLMEYPYECAEQVFSRYYANSLASHIANSDPKIEAVFNAWRDYQPDALKSNLEKNEELKSLILRETPWVREAESESEQKRRIALLFDMNKMASEQQSAILKLSNMQNHDGGWAWFEGGRSNRFITQHIVAGFGHLDALNVSAIRTNKATWAQAQKAIQYLDAELAEDLRQLKQHNKDWKDTKSISQIHVHYYYARSFFKDVPVKQKNQEAFDFYFNVMKKDWLSEQLYRDGLSALAFHRYGEKELANKLVTSLRERSITNDELGMYWKENTPSWWWYQAPIETQALMIELFDEVANDQNAVDELKVWLLKNKQTNSWATTKSTSEAVYALLLRGGEWLAVDDLVELELGRKPIDPTKLDGVGIEAGTGYFKTSFDGETVTPKMAEVKATKKGEGIAWGALYWQYFEDLDKITSFEETPLQLKKSLFKVENTATGEKITPITNKNIAIGDLVKVRVEVRVDRDMEFVHLKDMRASGFEPTNVLSQYKWQDGLGYYESTKDASTDFFFDYLPKGVYVFEYPLRANNAGEFSNGISTIQCMYAPEFTSHSQGERITIVE